MRQRQLPQQIRSERTRRHLLEAARRVFAKEGYAGATVDDIAQAAGYSKGAYYFHFASKEDILLALMDDWTRDRTRRLAAAADGALIDLLETLLSPESTDGWGARLLLEFWSQREHNPRVKRRLARAYRSWRDLLVRAFTRAQEAGRHAWDGAPEAAAEAALALHDGLVVQACLGLPTAIPPRSRAGAVLALLTSPGPLRAAEARKPTSVRAAG